MSLSLFLLPCTVWTLTHHSCTGSQALLLALLFSEEVFFFCGIASSLPPFSHFLCDEALQWMNNIPLESGSSLLSGSSPTVVKAKSSSEMLSSHLMSMDRKARQNERGKRERMKEKENEEGM